MSPLLIQLHMVPRLVDTNPAANSPLIFTLLIQFMIVPLFTSATTAIPAVPLLEPAIVRSFILPFSPMEGSIDVAKPSKVTV